MNRSSGDIAIANATERGAISVAEADHYRTRWQADATGTAALLKSLAGAPALVNATDRQAAAALRAGNTTKFAALQAKRTARHEQPPAATRSADERYAEYAAAADGHPSTGQTRPTPPPMPPVTASGIPVSALSAVPNVFARRAIADEPDQAKAYRMLQDYSGPHGELAAMVDISSGTGRIAQVAAAERVEHDHARTKAYDAFIEERYGNRPASTYPEHLAKVDAERARLQAALAEAERLGRNQGTT